MVSELSNNSRGRPLSISGIAGVCEKRLGTGKVHQLRHTFARMLKDASAKVSLIQQRLGHASADWQDTTQRAKQRPIVEKESQKWLTALRESVTLTPSEACLITVADREADIFEFLAKAAEVEAEYVIRAAQDRRVAGEVGQLWAHMATQEVAGEVTVDVAARPGKPARTAELRVRVAQLTHSNRQMPDAPCTTILADHEWKALYTTIHRTTTTPTTVPSVRQVVRWIAQIGGFLGRKGDGEPGITTMLARLVTVNRYSQHRVTV